MSSARNIIAVLVLAVAVTPASAEVMDKELSLTQVWAWGLLGATVGLLAIRSRWWVGFVSLPVAALGPFRALVEFRDPYVGPAIAREAGATYGAHALAALTLVLAAHGAAWANYLRQRRREPADAR